MIEMVISGGQTGVDRAALDVALELGIPCGGWCPKGRRDENGVIPERYPLQETTSKQYPVRTAKNILESDGTLILTWGKPDRGTALTVRLAAKHGKPLHSLDLTQEVNVAVFHAWIAEHGIRILNVAGPRESSSPGIHDRAVESLRDLFRPWRLNRCAPSEIHWGI